MALADAAVIDADVCLDTRRRFNAWSASTPSPRLLAGAAFSAEGAPSTQNNKDKAAAANLAMLASCTSSRGRGSVRACAWDCSVWTPAAATPFLLPGPHFPTPRLLRSRTSMFALAGEPPSLSGLRAKRRVAHARPTCGTCLLYTSPSPRDAHES
eukprot:362969-Chlamydomonas_euryale.AAC.1